MIERGTVIRAEAGSVDVRIAASDQCSSCGACDAAGLGFMVMHDVLDPVGAKTGDSVEVVVPEGSRIRGSLLAYGMPVALLILGYLAGFLLAGVLGTDPDTTGAVAGLCSVSAAVVVLRRKGGNLMSDQRFAPKVRAIIRRSVPS